MDQNQLLNQSQAHPLDQIMRMLDLLRIQYQSYSQNHNVDALSLDRL
jgi:hypothetical protein